MANILLAEDDPSLVNIFAKWIEAAGHTVKTVTNGTDGLMEAHFEGVPDLLVTDVMMPATDGESFATQFTAFAPNRPILVVTASSDSEKLARLKAIPSVLQVLKKPIDNQTLIQAVTEALQGAGKS